MKRRDGARPGAALQVLAAGALPGVLAGAQLAGLIFFLNPDLPFAAATVLRGIGLYGGMLGLAGALIHLPLLWGRPGRAGRLLPWTITLALAAAALLDWIHASLYAYYLPPGINDRLIKTAIWLSLAALIGFYTALLHTLHRRPYSRRSRLLFASLGVLSIIAMVERREAFHPRSAPRPRPSAVEVRRRPALWVVGLDTATLDAILPLAGQGRLPFLAKVLQQGAHGRIEALSPNRPESLWTSLATGKYPWKHGVSGGRLYRADWIARGAELHLLPAGIAFWRWGIPGRGSRLPHAYTRQALTLWEILPRLAVQTGMVSWPASAPVSRQAALALSDRFFTERGEPGNAQPPGLGARARLLRPDLGAVRSLVAASMGPSPPQAVVESVAGDLWRESLGLYLLDQRRDLGGLLLVLPGLRHVSRRYFGGYSAAQFQGAQARDSREAAELIAAYYSRLDTFLAELWAREAGPRVLAVVSAYGVEGSLGWRRVVGKLSREASLEGFVAGSPDGVLMLYGEGIQPGALITGARLVDLVPTLMYALGFPVARDLDGQVLTAAFEKPFLARNPLTFLPSYDSLAETEPFTTAPR
ncbi:MAG TPA: alkaline phosphatase family protein [Thermoanaerobaculia bacterium]|nr:alkaline phosphatase family protein [Thermoanaerobaculia bacterium]